MTELKDGGTRQTYSTGAQKEDASKTVGKGAYHLLPPMAIRRVAEIWRKGAAKYSERNWEKGLPLSRFIDSGLRHLFQYLEGMEDEDHLAQAAWNMLACLWTEEMIERKLLPQELADLPSYGEGEITVHESLTCSKWRRRTEEKIETDATAKERREWQCDRKCGQPDNYTYSIPTITYSTPRCTAPADWSNCAYRNTSGCCFSPGDCGWKK